VNKTNNTSTAQIQKDDFIAKSIRFVRITITQLPPGSWASFWEFKAFGNSSTPVQQDNAAIAKKTELYQNYPNPFNPETEIRYQLSSAGMVQLEIYDILGHKVKTLVDNKTQSGSQSICWNASDESGKSVPSGVYMYRIKLKTFDKVFADSKKMLLLK
jgi:hypothetical protein